MATSQAYDRGKFIYGSIAIKFMNYVASATIIALILGNAESHEAKLRCGVPGEQPQVDLIAGINKTAANRVLKSVIDRFAAMQKIVSNIFYQNIISVVNTFILFILMVSKSYHFLFKNTTILLLSSQKIVIFLGQFSVVVVFVSLCLSNDV